MTLHEQAIKRSGERAVPSASPVLPNQPETQATSVAALKSDFNALLASLKATGLMEADPKDAEGE